MSDEILLKNLPEGVVLSALQDIALYTVAFLTIHDADRNAASLLGSGVLVAAGKTRAILSADHVVGKVPTTGRIGLFLGRTNHVESIDAAGVVPVKVGRGGNEEAGPDLAALVLAPDIASTIGARKSFFNLDKYREKALAEAPVFDEGFWISQGFLAERTVVKADPNGDGMVKLFHNFTGVGRPEEMPTVGAFDYLDYPVDVEARPDSPVSYGGMSGSGIWQVGLRKNETGALFHLPPLLSGIVFYQHQTTKTQCGIKGHGRRSIYEKAYAALEPPR